MTGRAPRGPNSNSEEGSGALIIGAGETAPAGAAERLARLEEILADKRAKTFPVEGFDRQPLGPWAPVEADFPPLAVYVAERTKVDEETRRLAALFTEALALPSVVEATAPIDCPLCATQGSLTPHRIAHIRERVKDTEGFRAAEKAAREALGRVRSSAESAAKLVDAAFPRALVAPSNRRRKRGFRVERIRALLDPQTHPAVAAWLLETRRLWRARLAAARACKAALSEVDGYLASLESLADATAVRATFGAIGSTVNAVSGRLPAYGAAEKAVADPLKAVVDKASQTTGWPELLDLAKDPVSLRAALIERGVRAQARKELEQALRQIDKGIETVLDGKFQQLSASVESWWDLLRPDELSFFVGVKPRQGARRTIDFKAGLSATPDRSKPKLRDVIAVFSQSQLHCLGLALFIARSLHEEAGFIVLDDPILSSDGDYRAFFNTSVLEKLIDSGVQVIVLTQDQKSWKDMGSLYLHRNIALFQLALMDREDGTVVWNAADDLKGKLLRLETLVRNGHPTVRKQSGEDLRDAAERFCKEVLVKDRRAKSDKAAVISDYDGKNFAWLSPRVEPLLSKDPSHPGKLKVVFANLHPANHDDNIPSQGALTAALGILTQFVKEYL